MLGGGEGSVVAWLRFILLQHGFGFGDPTHGSLLAGKQIIICRLGQNEGTENVILNLIK